MKLSKHPLFRAQKSRESIHVRTLGPHAATRILRRVLCLAVFVSFYNGSFATGFLNLALQISNIGSADGSAYTASFSPRFASMGGLDTIYDRIQIYDSSNRIVSDSNSSSFTSVIAGATDFTAVKAALANPFTVYVSLRGAVQEVATFSVNAANLVPFSPIHFNYPPVNGVTVGSGSVFSWSGGFSTPNTGQLNVAPMTEGDPTSNVRWGFDATQPFFYSGSKITSATVNWVAANSLVFASVQERMRQSASFTTDGFTVVSGAGILLLDEGLDNIAAEKLNNISVVSVIPEASSVAALLGMAAFSSVQLYRRLRS